MNGKPIYTSKTVILSVCIFALGLLQILSGVEAVTPYTRAWVLFGISLATFVVRFITTEPLQMFEQLKDKLKDGK